MPWGLVVLLGGLAASTALDLQARGVEVVGPVPRGLPTPGLPSVAAGDLPALLGAGAALALVGLAEGLSAARLFAARGGYRIDADQELLASGAANVASGCSGARGGRQPVQDGGGQRRPRADPDGGLAAAVLALVVIVAIAPALSVLPRAVLSAIVVNAVWKLMDFAALRRYARVRRNDIVAAVVAAVGVLAFGPLNGLLLAVAGSVLGLVYRSSRVDVEVMGKVPHEKAAWGSIREPRGAPDVPRGAGAPGRRADLLGHRGAGPRRRPRQVDAAPGIRALVLDMEATNQMDTTSADALADLLGALRQRDVDLYLVRVMWPVRKALRRSGLMAELGEDHLWHSISQGVREARRAHGLKHLPSHRRRGRSRRGAAPRGGGGGGAHRCAPSGSLSPELHGRRSARLKAHRGQAGRRSRLTNAPTASSATIPANTTAVGTSPNTCAPAPTPITGMEIAT